MKPEQLDAVALWILHTFAIDAAETTPRLLIQSPEKGSGKTRLLEVLELLVLGPWQVASITVSALFRTIDDGGATLLMDETDAVFGPKARDNEDLRALLNAGYRRGAFVARVEGDKTRTVKRFSVFAPVALAGIGTLPDTIEDRGIKIPLRRRSPSEPVEKLRRRFVVPEAAELYQWIADDMTRCVDRLGALVPDVPDELPDRAGDIWEPLLAIADLAGGTWPERARRAALTLNGARVADDETLGVRLLADCRDTFGDDDRIRSDELVRRLIALDEAPWADLWGKALDMRGLARRLKPYGIRPAQHRFGDVTAKGYLRDDFTDPWSRYLPQDRNIGHTETSQALQGLGCFPVPDVSVSPGTDLGAWCSDDLAEGAA